MSRLVVMGRSRMGRWAVGRWAVGMLAAAGLVLGGVGLSSCGWLAAQSAAVAKGGDRLTVVGFNVESGGADPAYLARTVVATLPEVDVWGFSEVHSDRWTSLFEQAAEDSSGRDYGRLTGTTGGGDRLAVLYDADRLTLVRSWELDEINPGGRVRSPLVLQLQERGGQRREFLFVVNHLYRSDNAARHRQAQQLNQWAQTQTLPIVAVGDYNFDWDVPSQGQRRDRGFDNLTANGVMTWVQPAPLLTTHCSRRYNSILDFTFVGGTAQQWRGQATILFPETSYCPDDQNSSDHRPVRAEFRW